jgi:3-hydroxymyristoyl/3-hydroxydecanoyl-(acyl carrier protein) dehydratase
LSTIVDLKKTSDGDMLASVTVDADSSWFEGHFPGDPIFPGIAQLKLVADLVAEHGEGNLIMTGVSRVKFRKIVRPGEQLDVQATCSSEDNTSKRYSFRITSSGEDVCSGMMVFARNNKNKQ